jgi:hypothetical protein
LRWSRPSTASIGGALVTWLHLLATANAQGIRDDADALHGYSPGDFSALGYAGSGQSGAATRMLPQPIPAVDWINGKVEGYGGGASQTTGFYGGAGSLALPVSRQWGAQFDGGLAKVNGTVVSGVAGHLFWRDPSIGLAGAYASFSSSNGTDLYGAGRVGTSHGRFAAEGEYYWNRWTFRGLVGSETVGVDALGMSEHCLSPIVSSILSRPRTT